VTTDLQQTDALRWKAGRFEIDLEQPRVMGIVNVTPDSFSDGGRHADPSAALAHCERLLEEGADILDIGGASTRPGACSPSAQEEMDRVLPLLRHAVTLGCPVSVDTSEPQVMRAALDLGVDIVNDVRALQRPGALELLATTHPSAGVCLMHMQGEPADMQTAPAYGDVLDEVTSFLRSRLSAACKAGIRAERVVLDPGFGFGKNLEHNLALMQGLEQLIQLGAPLLVGWSRKGTLGRLTGRPVGDRLVPSVAAALASVAHGVQIVRVHDVAATVDALKVWGAMGPRSPRARPRAGDWQRDNSR